MIAPGDNAPLRLLCMLAVLLLLQLQPADVHAAAGDSIGNRAVIIFDVGNGLTMLESSPSGNSVTGVGKGADTAFIEDRVVNFTVITTDSAAVEVTIGQVDAVTTFTLTNTGNDVQDFLVTAVNTTPNPFGTPADSFNPVAPMQAFVESGTTPGYQRDQDTDVFVDELAVLASATVYVVVNVPAVTVDDVAAVALVVQVAEGGSASVEGTAITNDDNGNVSPGGTYSNGTTAVAAGTPNDTPDSGGMDTVFNDPAGASPEDADSTGLAQDIAQNGQHSDASAYQAALIVSPVTLENSVTVFDTLGGSDPHAGSTLRYRLDVTVSSGKVVNNLVIRNPIPAHTTYTPATIVLNGVAQTDADDAPTDFSQFNGTEVIVDLSRGGAVQVLPADINVITFDVTID